MYPSRKAAGRIVARGGAALALAATVLLAGCHNFFVCQKASCPSSGSGGGSTSTDYVYVSNATAGSTYVSGYNIGNGSLAAITGSPFNLTYIPVAMTVSPNDAILYVASLPGAANPGIYVYSINSSTGQLSGPNGGQVQISGAISSMDISPDGKFLFSVDTTGTLLTEYTIDSSGNLARAGTFGLPGTDCTLGGAVISQTCTVKVAPSGEFVLASLGSAGTAIYPYSSSSGITTTSPLVIPSGSTQASPSGDYSVTLDSNNYVYIARTSALAVYQITDSAGDASLKSTASYATGVIPRSIVLSANQGYVYTANEGAGTISSYSINSSAALTQVSGSPFTGPTNVSALGVDKSGTYMVAAGYNGSSGVQLFTIGSTGGLTLVTSAGTGTSTAYPAILAMTH
ncbi:MAG TPA: beta-propeller fold lactonase family protein [Acidobacteriaceae bacterium]|nr:beta-propeller fold lactonase family protein [Acidobacteriaceae bacterium]